MGIVLSKIWHTLFSRSRDYRVVVIGLNNAGKSLSRVLDESVLAAPTVGSNVEELQHKNVKFTMWDVGGQSALRTSWPVYIANSQVIICVIDSADRERMNVIKQELFSILLRDDIMKDISCVLVYANKQGMNTISVMRYPGLGNLAPNNGDSGCILPDLPDAMSSTEITSAICLHDIKNKPWHIQGCCALTGQGLAEGLDWITTKLPK